MLFFSVGRTYPVRDAGSLDPKRYRNRRRTAPGLDSALGSPGGGAFLGIYTGCGALLGLLFSRTSAPRDRMSMAHSIPRMVMGVLFGILAGVAVVMGCELAFNGTWLNFMTLAFGYLVAVAFVVIRPR